MLLTPPLLLADYAGYVDASDRSEIRIRTTQQLTNPGAPAGTPEPAAQFGVDAYTEPALRLRLTNRRFEFTFAYLPSLTVTDLEEGSGAQAQILQNGHIGVAWRADRQVTITVAEDGTYGLYNSANVGAVPIGATGAATAGGAAPTPGQAPTPVAGAPTPPPAPMTGANLTPLQAAPQPKTITLVASHTGADVGVQVDRQVNFAVRGGYFTAGGLGDTSQFALPLQYGPAGVATLNYALSRRDFSITSAGASVTQFTSLPCFGLYGVGSLTALCRPRDQIAQFSQGFQHAFERKTAFTAQGGIAFVRMRNDDDQPYRAVWFPTALMSVVHREGPKGARISELDLQLVPVINAFSGALANFLQLQGLLTEPLAHNVLLRVAGGGAQTIPTEGPTAATIVQGGVEVDFAINKQLDLGVGERAYWQRQALGANVPVVGVQAVPEVPLAFADFFSTVTYFAVTVRAPALRF